MTRTTRGSMPSASRACSIAHSALPGEPQPRSSTIATSRSPSSATSGARCLYRAPMGAHRSGPRSRAQVAVANRPRREPGRAGLWYWAGRQAPRGSLCRPVEDEVVPEAERRQYLRQCRVVDHFLQVAGTPSPPRSRVGASAAGRCHRIVAGAQQQVGRARGPRDRQGRRLAGLPRPVRPGRSCPRPGRRRRSCGPPRCTRRMPGSPTPKLLPEGVEGVS